MGTPAELASLRLHVQHVVGDKFDVGDLLGRDGFAAVFRARDRMLGRDVAIKVLDPRFAASSSLTYRFLNEARTVAALEHPNISTRIRCRGARGPVVSREEDN
jgi:serine/threonine protein kinase